MSAPVSPSCPRCGDRAPIVVRGYGTLQPSVWLCRRCLVRLKRHDRLRIKEA